MSFGAAVSSNAQLGEGHFQAFMAFSSTQFLVGYWTKDHSFGGFWLEAALSSLPHETSLHALAFSKLERGNECPSKAGIMYFNHIHIIMHILSQSPYSDC